MHDDADLAAFLRARREQVRPEDVGLPAGGRRRTPGLRREEVATLAGISVDYLIRLEQGRDRHPSGPVIHALGRALQLSEDERVHLGRLAAISAEPALCPAPPPIVSPVSPGVHTILQRLDPVPAFVLGPLGDVLESNGAWRRLVQPLGLFDTVPVNLAEHVFTHPLARHVFPDWARVADEQVRRLRSAAIRWGEDDRFLALLERLGREPEFAVRWQRHTVAEKHRGTKRLRHPVAGELALDYEVLVLPDDSQQLVTWLPADAATEAALRRVLTPTPAGRALRVVGEA